MLSKTGVGIAPWRPRPHPAARGNKENPREHGGGACAPPPSHVLYRRHPSAEPGGWAAGSQVFLVGPEGAAGLSPGPLLPRAPHQIAAFSAPERGPTLPPQPATKAVFWAPKPCVETDLAGFFQFPSCPGFEKFPASSWLALKCLCRQQSEGLLPCRAEILVNLMHPAPAVWLFLSVPDPSCVHHHMVMAPVAVPCPRPGSRLPPKSSPGPTSSLGHR